MRNKRIKRAITNSKRSGKFNANSGTEGQINVKRNAKGEVELVAFFGGKWYYCPMSEFNKSINARHGMTIGNADVMTSTQTGTTGFSNLRLNAVTSEWPPRVGELVMFVDEVPATGRTPSTGTITFTFSADDPTLTYVAGDYTGVVVGLNAYNQDHSSSFDNGAFITSMINSDGDEYSSGDTLATIELSSPCVAAHSGSNDGVVFQTIISTRPNTFFNMVYTDIAGKPSYYHKFQLNMSTVSPFSRAPSQSATSGLIGGGGGTGEQSSSGGSGPPDSGPLIP